MQAFTPKWQRENKDREECHNLILSAFFCCGNITGRQELKELQDCMGYTKVLV